MTLEIAAKDRQGDVGVWVCMWLMEMKIRRKQGSVWVSVCVWVGECMCTHGYVKFLSKITHMLRSATLSLAFHTFGKANMCACLWEREKKREVEWDIQRAVTSLHFFIFNVLKIIISWSNYYIEFESEILYFWPYILYWWPHIYMLGCVNKSHLPKDLEPVQYLWLRR